MPCKRTLTGRRERRMNRNSQYLLRHRHVNTSVEDDNLVVVLCDTFKCALNELPMTFANYSCGSMDIRCVKCNALHFKKEMTGNDKDKFTLCCHKGKVSLMPYSENSFFQTLCQGLASTDQAIKLRSKNYFENIRQFNSSFAMVSSEAKVDERVASGVYHFKIHDTFYHRAGPIAHMGTPRYAQLYFYDVDSANNYRMGQQSNAGCNRELMRDISYELNRINPFVQSFYTMQEYCNLNQNRNVDVYMAIKTNMSETDIRRFNDAVRTDVAAIFTTTEGEPPFERGIVVFQKNNAPLKHVSVLNRTLDPLAYPLLFPNGDTGWHENMIHDIPTTSTANRPRNLISNLQYVAYRLAIRDGFSILHSSQKLFLQWIVDQYVRIEGARLHFIKNHQANLRSDLYNNLTDFLESNAIDGPINLGKKVILPSSFTGSPRNMYQNYLDAMLIVQHFGKPSLFITMTCNPNWSEIAAVLKSFENSNFRPELIVRVFKIKLKELIDSIVVKKIFGTVVAIIYTIEFQKRGLPHAHILITLHENDKISGPIDIDKIVCAEIPDPIRHPQLNELVRKHMMHGPCGALNPNSVCMRDGKCSKTFPRDFIEFTSESVNGYPLYKRPDNRRGVVVNNVSLDNRYVVPYNPYLLAKFNCHINVEVCTTVKSVKYIYKYVYKGYDSATLEVGITSTSNNGQNVDLDEVRNYLNCRYVGSTEAVWRIYEFPMHYQSHTIYRLDIHLPDRQNIIFRPGQELQAIQNVRDTKLTAFFKLNNAIANPNERFKYIDIPLNYVWHNDEKEWKVRKRGAEKIIARMYSVAPKNVELFHLRLLLLHAQPTSFDDLRTFNGILYDSFIEACHARGIASNDNEWRECLIEARQIYLPRQLRELFGFICALNVPANALDLWEEFKADLSEDYLRDYDNPDNAYNRALLHIQEICLSHNVTCAALGLPTPTFMSENENVEMFDPTEANAQFEELYGKSTEEQKRIIDEVIREVQFHDTGSNVFCLTAHAGCGKTFIQTTIIHRLHALNVSVIATAFSGIASTLLIGGRTLHNAFKLPIPILDTSVANITANSAHGREINAASLILIDEISMCPVQVLKIIDRLLRDLCTDVENKRKLFAGKTMLLCGDFRQILPVVPHGSRAILIENCITSWNEFPTFHRITLNQNMRALPEEVEFVEFLIEIGNGTSRQNQQYGTDIIEVPQQLLGDPNDIIKDIYGDIQENILSERMLTSVILAPTNDDCAKVNNDVLNRMVNAESKTYLSTDKILANDQNEVHNYPVEFLNSISVSGLPPHNLVLKENCIVLLIRNLNTAEALVNGTRMRVKVLHHNAIDCEILTGTASGKRILIPRINLTYSGTILPFEFQRRQFPVILAFAMTINKSQGQTFERVGVLLTRPVFTHGQLYVAASRVRSFNGLRFYILESIGQGKLAGDVNGKVYTKNIVYNEVLTK